MTAEHAPATALITGGAGFIGSNLVRWLLDSVPHIHVVNFDALTYAGNSGSLRDVEARHGRYQFVHGDVRDPHILRDIFAGSAHDTATGRSIPPPDTVLHLAAESHVDRSIDAPSAFISTNVLGTGTLLDAVREELDARPRPFRFVHVSTDEVYGSLPDTARPFTEDDPMRPNSPYSASKAGADCLVRAYRETYGLPCIITRCSNNFGPFQHPEKFIPYMLTRALRNEPLPLYGDGCNVRDWLHVSDHVAALWQVCTSGQPADEIYNIGGDAERRNVDVAASILDILEKPHSLIQFVADRPGHDRRYAIDGSRIKERLGWSPARDFDSALGETIEWYLANEDWWKAAAARGNAPTLH